MSGLGMHSGRLVAIAAIYLARSPRRKVVDSHQIESSITRRGRLIVKKVTTLADWGWNNKDGDKRGGLFRRSKIVRLLLVVASWSAGSQAAIASTAVGKIVTVSARSTDNLHFVLIEGERSAKPVCAGGPYFMIKVEGSDTGKSQFAMLMAAFLADRPVTVAGTGSCVRWSDGEDIAAVSYVR